MYIKKQNYVFFNMQHVMSIVCYSLTYLCSAGCKLFLPQNIIKQKTKQEIKPLFSIIHEVIKIRLVAPL